MPGIADQFYAVCARQTAMAEHDDYSIQARSTHRRQCRVAWYTPRPLRGREPDQPPLDVVAAPVAQHGCGLLVLNPFRHRLDFQPARQVDQRLHEGTVIGRARDVLHEGAVDLHDIDAELAQIPERGVTGAEIVDRNPAAEA